ncbi:unnamed protein product, partial [Cyprideis torosa]
RKSVRAAIVLLPLLGITNLAQSIPSQLGKSVVEFALWSFSSTFLSSFNGFFVAFLYCFCSKDVKLTVHNLWRRKITLLEARFRNRGQNHSSSAFEQEAVLFNVLQRTPSNKSYKNKIFKTGNRSQSSSQAPPVILNSLNNAGASAGPSNPRTPRCPRTPPLGSQSVNGLGRSLEGPKPRHIGGSVRTSSTYIHPNGLRVHYPAAFNGSAVSKV